MNEPLLTYVPSPRRRQTENLNTLFSLPEDEQVDLPLLQSPGPNGISDAGAFKERLIFGTNAEPGPSDIQRHSSLPRVRSRDDGEEVSEEGLFCFEGDSVTPRRRVNENSGNTNEQSNQRAFVLDIPDEGYVGPSRLRPLRDNDGGRRRNLHRSRTAPAMTNMSNLKSSLKRPELDSASSIVKQAIIYLILYLSVGVLIYSFNKDKFSGKETNPVVDALYFCIVTMCTIGYGDITPMTMSTKLFACLFVLVGFGFIDILLGGMVTFVLDKQENLLLHTVEGSHHDIAKTYIVDVKKGRMRIRMKVAIALGAVVLCIGVGTMVMHIAEGLGWIDAFYLSVMSVTTVGYGDHAFKTKEGRIFASIWLLVSTLAVARAFLYFAEARIDKRHRLIAKWVLQRDMTIQDLLAADIDNNGYVSKSEYVIYKLKEMGKVEEKDVIEVVKQFNRLDPDNSGKITLSLLSGGH